MFCQVLNYRFIAIGAIFDENNFNDELAFQSAIHRENMYNKDIEFVAKIVKLSTSDTYAIEKEGKNYLTFSKQQIFSAQRKLTTHY